MRWQKLLAIAALCPLTVVAPVVMLAPACQQIDQPVGQYSAAASRTQRPDTAPVSMQAGAPISNDVELVTPADASSGAPENIDEGTEPTAVGVSTPQQPTAAPFIPPAVATLPIGTSTGGGVPEVECRALAVDIARRMRLDMYIVVDANISLPATGLWEFVTTGLKRFFADRRSQNIGAGLRFFGATCDPDDYNFKPQVEVGLVSENEQELVDVLNTRTAYTASPLQPALQGGIAHQLRRAKANPDTKQIVVLLTDGFTQDLMCRYSRQDVENEAAKGFTGSPQIETYVVGFGLPDTMNPIADDVLARFAALDPIAEQGGTRKAYNVKFSEDPFLLEEALHSIRRTGQPCVYEVPTDIDLETLNVSYFATRAVPRVDDKAKCGQMEGFFYVNDDNGQPKSFELCAASCNAVQRTDALLVLYNKCPTERR